MSPVMNCSKCEKTKLEAKQHHKQEQGISRNCKRSLHLTLELKKRMQRHYHCHARMREILSYLHIPKTTAMCYIYEANSSD